MIPEHRTAVCDKMLVAFLAFSLPWAVTTRAGERPAHFGLTREEEIFSLDDSDSHCPEVGVLGGHFLNDHGHEGLSLMQVGARRLQKAAAAKSAAAAPRAAALQDGKPNTAVVDDSIGGSKPHSKASAAGSFVVLQVVEARMSEVARYGAHAFRQLATTRSTYVLSIVIVAVVGLVALCLLAVALQPSHAARDSLAQGNISQNFPRAHSGPYTRQGVPGSANASYGQGLSDARPSFRDTLLGASTRQMYWQEQPPSPKTLHYNTLATSSGQNHPPRVSTTSRSTPKPSILPRVQGTASRPGSRPGTALDLTASNSLTPKKQEVGHAMPPAPELRPPEVTGFAPRRPPPLCPMLVLPHCESFFAVPIDQLVAGMETVEILGLSGNALLRSTVKDTAEGPIIEVSMSPPRSPPLASISSPATFGPRTGMMELKGSRGKHYGWLRPAGSGYALRCGEDDVMTVVTNAGSGQCHLYAGSNGDMLAQASRSGDAEAIFAPEDLEVRVTPGMDAVLALLCVVSAVLFGCGLTAFAFPPARASESVG